MRKKFAVIFDMDGVLVDSNPFHKIALKHFCSKHGHHLTDEQLLKKIYGRTNRDWIINLFGNITDDQIKQFADEKESLFRQLYENDIKPVSGLVSFLELLEKNEVPKAIATSAPRVNVDFTLDKTGIGKYFKIILDDTFVTRGKPDPEIYVKTAKALNMPPERCIVIEDSLSGIEAGQAAGARVIGITTTHGPAEMAHADYVIDNFTQLNLRVLEKIAGANT